MKDIYDKKQILTHIDYTSFTVIAIHLFHLILLIVSRLAFSYEVFHAH
jgi:hypothetical protein